MTTLVEPLYSELLRYVYVLSTSHWPAALTEVSLGALAVTFVVAASRLWIASAGPSRSVRQGREET